MCFSRIVFSINLKSKENEKFKAPQSLQKFFAFMHVCFVLFQSFGRQSCPLWWGASCSGIGLPSSFAGVPKRFGESPR